MIAKKIDLHVHSTYSDGTFTPSELVHEAERAGLSAMALTDHDTTAGIPEAMQAAAGSGNPCRRTFYHSGASRAYCCPVQIPECPQSAK